MGKRSIWKGPYIDPCLLRLVRKNKTGKQVGSKVIKMRSRRSTIIPAFIGLVFGVYNGKKYVPVAVTEEMVGYKFGEFSPTRTYYGHAGDKKGRSDAKKR